MKFRLSLLTLAASVFLIAGCTTYSYYGPDYVESNLNKSVKSVEQKSMATDNQMIPTYDEEFIHDEKGNLLKFRQTEYVNTKAENKEFITWETEYTVLGGKAVPSKISCNGVPFVEVSYELLSTKSTGNIDQETMNRRFLQVMSPTFGKPITSFWLITLASYPVAFASDNMFVTTQKDNEDNSILTTGFDNIALKSFKFSKEKKFEGLSKTSNAWKSEINRSMDRGSTVEFNYSWSVIADKICQTKMHYVGERTEIAGGSYRTIPVDFTSEAEYDKAGNRTKETWYVTREDKKGPVKSVVFEENLKY